MPTVNVLIVDDSAAARAGLKRLLDADPGISVIGMAGDAFDAAQQMRRRLPDVMILDLALPKMDGLTFLGKIMAQHPMPVLICSSHAGSGSDQAFRALELGAAGVIAKPRIASQQDRDEAQVALCDAVRAAAATASGRTARARPAPPAAARPGPKLTADAVLPPARPVAGHAVRGGPLVAIGASTGGTEALLALLRALPPAAPPIAIVQHMPENFTAAFARRLDGLCAIEVREAQTGDHVAPGQALIAPGNRHMALLRQGTGYRVNILEGPYVARHRPSVDVLFRSAAQQAGQGALGVLMTGMGDDGARGLREMRDFGAQTFVQDEASCVVFGMPKEALAMGGAARSVPLQRIAGEIMRWSGGQVVA
ncbi:chemotaxis-specific protein-glutamate methyltransferase CheB [Poseidonocella sp. HB161398]|uniref:chemotaxis-specific protein-glutamate methyltransferase CheB n=1 Tax=Poseidonocella sp. HB161398 TaxID=2320855 RepID=UPI00110993BA|nr:chemotaxis-specific protein-glutamate methyltransferase CheB [Poseidonocella sp. HB161398]